MMYYNFVRIHTKLRVTPAMAAGVTDRLWEMSDIVALGKRSSPRLVSGGRIKRSMQMNSRRTE